MLTPGLLALLLAGAPALPPVQDGDLVFQASRSAQSQAVQRATHSPWSHMGIVFLEGGRPLVVEAVEPVKKTPLDRWAARGEGGRVVVKRLRDSGERLTPAARAALQREAERFLGRHYDLAFGWSDDRIYCSELAWKAYQRALGVELAPLQRLRDFDLTDPAVKAKLRERYGRKVPLDEPVVAPSALFDSPLLVEVPAPSAAPGAGR